MPADRRFRFGLQVRGDNSADDLRAIAIAAEHAGFDVLSTFDHIGTHWSALTPLTAMAAATERIRICPLVLNNDFWHPVHLAARGGRDRPRHRRASRARDRRRALPHRVRRDRAPFDPPAVRKRRLAEAIEILRRLLDGEEVTHRGDHYSIDGLQTMRSRQEHLPILAGVNGRDALAHAAATPTSSG